MTDYLLSIDQGTTSSRAILFSGEGALLAASQREFPQHFPQAGWVEHDPEDLWESVRACCAQVMADSGLGAKQIAAIGITNQRETTLVWERASGKPLYRAIVWQDRRTADYCAKLKRDGVERKVTDKTGLLIDPYFSATKIRWILDHVPGARARAARGELAFGTVDSYLLWRLTAGKVHLTDATNASRTLLFNIHTQSWDEELLALFGVPAAMMPQVTDCAHSFGVSDAALFGGGISLAGVAGDQQAALVGQACFTPGTAKSTYGTGCFLMLNTGDQAFRSNNRLLTTVAYRLKGRTTYALEGSIFIAGAAIQWLRDSLHLIDAAAESEALATQAGIDHGVYLVPAFTGLGAPYWDPDARGALMGLRRDTGIKEIVSAALQSVCFQTRDLQLAMESDGVPLTTLRVDGGMVVNNWLLQFLSDTLAVAVDRPHVTETTALGAAYLAGLQAGIFESPESLQSCWQRDRCFQPQMAVGDRSVLYQGWQRAVARVRT